MGYTTEFSGRFELNKPLTVPDFNWLKNFNNERHDDLQAELKSYYCQWVGSEDGLGIEWDEGEKFYGYVDWLKYLIENFFGPKGYVLNGRVRYQGEEMDDTGWIEIAYNQVKRTELDISGLITCPKCGAHFTPGQEIAE